MNSCTISIFLSLIFLISLRPHEMNFPFHNSTLGVHYQNALAAHKNCATIYGSLKHKASTACERPDLRIKCHAIDFDPSDATLLSNRSLCWGSVWDKLSMHALTDGKACKAVRPDWPKACYREGAALCLFQKFDEAANSFYKGVKLDPENKKLVCCYCLLFMCE